MGWRFPHSRCMMQLHREQRSQVMMTVGDKVKYVEFWDADAVDQAVGRKVELGELGTIVHQDDGCALIRWDGGGKNCFMSFGEIELAS
jgi:hypothetical protein